MTAIDRLTAAYAELTELTTSAIAPHADDLDEAAELIENVVDAVRGGRAS